MISIIIPVFCVEKYLDRCIESVVEQTYMDLDIVIVDDGSTDSSAEICDEWARKDSRIRVFHQENLGVSVARNAGLKAARGEYVMFLDSDDYLDSRACEILVDNLGDAEFALGSYTLLREKDRFTTKTISSYSGKIEDFLLNIEEYFNAEVIQGPSGKLYCKSIIDSHNIMFDEKKSFGEDTEFVYEFLCHTNRVGVVNYPLVYINQTPGSLSRTFREDKYDLYLELVNKFERMCLSHNIGNVDKVVNRMKCHAFSSFVCEIWRCEDRNLALKLIKRASTYSENIEAYRKAENLTVKYFFLKWLFRNEYYTLIYFLSLLRHLLLRK